MPEHFGNVNSEAVEDSVEPQTDQAAREELLTKAK
jgi:hypothetical protein